MCKKCLESVERYSPGVTEQERSDLLWGATAFPACGSETVERQLAEHVAAGAVTVGAACARADEQTEAAMAEFNLRSQFLGWGWEPSRRHDRLQLEAKVDE